MHEVSLCRELAAAVTRAVPARIVETVYVEVGELRQVVPEALAFAWTFVVRDTALDGARLDLTSIPAVITCDDCGHHARLGPQLGFRCPACGSARTHVSSGDQLRLTAVDVRQDAATSKGEPDGAFSPA